MPSAITRQILLDRKFALVLYNLSADTVLYLDFYLVIAGRHERSRHQAGQGQALAGVAQTAPILAWRYTSLPPLDKI